MYQEYLWSVVQSVTIERASFWTMWIVLTLWVLWLFALVLRSDWRRGAQQFLRRAAFGTLIALGLYVGARLTFLIELAVVWEPVTVDRVAFGTFVLFVLFFGLWMSAFRVQEESARERLQTLYVGLGGAVVSVLTLYVAYTTFRASNMLGALQYISDQGNNIGDMETETDEVLCLYRWGESPTENLSQRRFRAGCGDEIFVNADKGELAPKFDDIQLYIEETILFAMESRVYINRYGADFYQGLEYWIEDFSEDWSGAFSYYIISREMDAAGRRGETSVDARSLACLERFTGIRIENICGKYGWFLNRLGTAGEPSRREGFTCDVPTDLGATLELPGSDYSCDQSYWGASFRGLQRQD